MRLIRTLDYCSLLMPLGGLLILTSPFWYLTKNGWAVAGAALGGAGLMALGFILFCIGQELRKNKQVEYNERLVG